MKIKNIFILLFLLLPGLVLRGQVPDPALIGYWHNWNDVNAPYIPLANIDSRYQIIDVAFAVPHPGTDYKMEFIPDQETQAAVISGIQALQSQGKKVLVSIGGAAATVSLDNPAERDTFIATMNGILNTYGFDGIDIDLEGSSVTVTGGTISAPADAPIINLVYAIRQIMSDYYSSNNRRMLLTMAPETAFVHGGMSAYGGIWGAYLPVLDALRDSIEILHVQLYNSGSMYGIDGNIYTQGTADFIVALTEAVIQGFNTAGGFFAGLPAGKVAVGLPACPNAAGGGFTDTATVHAAMNYLRGGGPQPGSYVLSQAGGYPSLRGMMTWSINWDAAATCAPAYQYAENYENIFGSGSASSDGMTSIQEPIFVYPNPSADIVTISGLGNKMKTFHIYNSNGEVVLAQQTSGTNQTIHISHLPAGIYLLKLENSRFRLTRQ